jgi:hypothetical protein
MVNYRGLRLKRSVPADIGCSARANTDDDDPAVLLRYPVYDAIPVIGESDPIGVSPAAQQLGALGERFFG